MSLWKRKSISTAQEERRWERWRIIFNILENQQVASISELLEATGGKAALLEMDLDSLCRSGLIRRTARHGIALEGYHPEKSLEERIMESTEAKGRIARLVAEKYVQPGMTLFLDASTTVAAIGPYLASLKLLVVTNGLSLIRELRQQEFVGDIVCTGGYYRALSNSVVGSEATRTISHYKADLALIGTNGISSHMEVMEAHPDEALVKRAMVKHAQKTLVLALPEKFRDSSLLPITSLSQVDALISTSFTNAEFVRGARETGVRLECPA